MATKDINKARGKYLVNFDSQTEYKIISGDPIGRGSGNISVYKVAYSILEGKPASSNHDFLAVKKASHSESKAFDKLYKEVFTRNNALPLPYHKNLMRVDAIFFDNETQDLCVVMPFAERGSLRSILADTFPYGFPEVCISVALKSVVKALRFLHDTKIVHRDVNAGHVYVKSGPQIMLGFAATVYEHEVSNLECSSHSALPAIEISDWAAASEVYGNGNEKEYSEKADIWLVGITALELAYGGIRVPNREALEGLIREIIETKRLPKNYQLLQVERKEEKKEEDEKGKKKIEERIVRFGVGGSEERRSFSREFETMVAECLAWNPADRPTARTLLEHDFFTNNGGLNWSTLKSNFQQVVIERIKNSSDMKNWPTFLDFNPRRPKSQISIPGPKSNDEEALNQNPKFPSSSYYASDEKGRQNLRMRFKRTKRKLFDQQLSDPEVSERNVEVQSAEFDDPYMGDDDEAEACWEIQVEQGREDWPQVPSNDDSATDNTNEPATDASTTASDPSWEW